MTELKELVQTLNTRPKRNSKSKRVMKHIRLTPAENQMLVELTELLEVTESEVLRRSIHVTHALLLPQK